MGARARRQADTQATGVQNRARGSRHGHETHAGGKFSGAGLAVMRRAGKAKRKLSPGTMFKVLLNLASGRSPDLAYSAIHISLTKEYGKAILA